MRFTKRTYRAAHRRALANVLQAKYDRDRHLDRVQWRAPARHPDADAHRATIRAAVQETVHRLNDAINHAARITTRGHREKGLWP